MYVILRGAVKLVAQGVTVMELSAGAHLGEMGLIDDVPRTASALVTESGKALRISRREFEQILRKEPPLAVKLLWSFTQSLAGQVRETAESLAKARAALATAAAAPAPEPEDLSGGTQVVQLADMTGELEVELGPTE
jgi:CRP-like cAMP-binding protein